MVSSSEFYDVVILTMKKDSNVLENGYIKQAFIRNGISATIMNWDSNSFDFLNSCKLMIIRSCWDYHLRVDEFLSFLKKHGEKILNPYEIVQWNHNKKYLKELESKGVRIPETILISEKDLSCDTDLKSYIKNFKIFENSSKIVFKPAISAGGEDTILLEIDKISKDEEIKLKNLISLKKEILIQEYIENLNLKGEISLIFFYGEYSHSVIKKPAEDDFRVQGQYGGKNFVYNPTDEEIEFGKLILSLIDKKLCYARVDIMYNNQNKLCLGEIELIEPFLFMTMQDKKTNSLIADNFVNLVKKNESNLIKTDN